eukprot:Hpha_TRINITY_DN12256_c0_g1::TRINITY_DN12256_c0_g1_i1::g.17046::m.17046
MGCGAAKLGEADSFLDLRGASPPKGGRAGVQGANPREARKATKKTKKGGNAKRPRSRSHTKKAAPPVPPTPPANGRHNSTLPAHNGALRKTSFGSGDEFVTGESADMPFLAADKVIRVDGWIHAAIVSASFPLDNPTEHRRRRNKHPVANTAGPSRGCNRRSSSPDRPPERRKSHRLSAANLAAYLPGCDSDDRENEDYSRAAHNPNDALGLVDGEKAT